VLFSPLQRTRPQRSPASKHATDKSTVRGPKAAAKGRMTVACVRPRASGALGVISAGHELGGPDPVACLMAPDIPLKLRVFVNPPACLGAPSFTIANSSDAYPNAHRIEEGDAPLDDVVCSSGGARGREPVHDRPRDGTRGRRPCARARQLSVADNTVWFMWALNERIFYTLPSSRPRSPRLGTRPACIYWLHRPGQLRTLHNVGLCVTRLPMEMSAAGAVPLTFMFTYLCVHDGAAWSGPAPAHGDAGGPAFRRSSIPAAVPHSTRGVRAREVHLRGLARRFTAAALLRAHARRAGPRAAAVRPRCRRRRRRCGRARVSAAAGAGRGCSREHWQPEMTA